MLLAGCLWLAAGCVVDTGLWGPRQTTGLGVVAARHFETPCHMSVHDVGYIVFLQGVYGIWRRNELPAARAACMRSLLHGLAVVDKPHVWASREAVHRR